jgi:hypothetical protein
MLICQHLFSLHYEILNAESGIYADKEIAPSPIISSK